MLRQKPHMVAVLGLVGVYLFLQWLASRPPLPAIAPETTQRRQPFPVDFTLPDLQGRPMRLSDLQGQVVLVNLWATWCYPCRLEIPSMHALYQDYRSRGFEILAIASDVQGKAVVAPLVAEYGLTFPVLVDPQNVVGTRLLVQGIPTSYLLDKQGRIAGLERGSKNWNSAKFRRLLDSLLAEGGTTP